MFCTSSTHVLIDFQFISRYLNEVGVRDVPEFQRSVFCSLHFLCLATVGVLNLFFPAYRVARNFVTPSELRSILTGTGIKVQHIPRGSVVR